VLRGGDGDLHRCADCSGPVRRISRSPSVPCRGTRAEQILVYARRPEHASRSRPRRTAVSGCRHPPRPLLIRPTLGRLGVGSIDLAGKSPADAAFHCRLLFFVRWDRGAAGCRGVRPGQGTGQRQSGRRRPPHPPLLFPALGRLGVGVIDLAVCRRPPLFSSRVVLLCVLLPISAALNVASRCSVDCIRYFSSSDFSLSSLLHFSV
jgi:hypothetical protein